MRIESRDQFEALQSQARENEADRAQQVLVCCGTGCLATGAKKVAEAFADEIAKRSLDADVSLFVKPTGCHGFCERGPLVALQSVGDPLHQGQAEESRGNRREDVGRRRGHTGPALQGAGERRAHRTVRRDPVLQEPGSGGDAQHRPNRPDLDSRRCRRGCVFGICQSAVRNGPGPGHRRG